MMLQQANNEANVSDVLLPLLWHITSQASLTHVQTQLQQCQLQVDQLVGELTTERQLVSYIMSYIKLYFLEM